MGQKSFESTNLLNKTSSRRLFLKTRSEFDTVAILVYKLPLNFFE